MRIKDGQAVSGFTSAEIDACLDLLRANFDRAQVLHQQGNRAIVRLFWAERGMSFIAKLWSHRKLLGNAKRLLGITPSQWEWRNFRRLDRAGVPVARVLACSRVNPAIRGYTDVIFLEDLGDCELATEHLKRLIQSGDENAVLRFEDALIEMMEGMLAAGVIDTDHGMANVVVQKSGRPVRLDLELARVVVWPRLSFFAHRYGEMIGRVIGLHAFAVQPNVERSTRFAARVQARLKPSHRALLRATDYAQAMMRRQLTETGIDTRLELPWA